MDRCKHDTSNLSYHGKCYVCALNIPRDMRENCPVAALYDSLDLANEEIRHAYSDIETHRQRIAKLETENERLKEMVCSPIDFNHWKKDIEVKGESLMKQYIDATYRAKELEAEIERLKREQLEWSREALEHAKELEAENCQLEQYRRWYDEETAPLRAENARLKEELEVYMERKTDGKKQFAMMEQIRAENARLKECMKDMFSMEDMDAAQFEVNRLTIENALLREVVEAARKVAYNEHMIAGEKERAMAELRAALARLEGK